jgi:hypothetical protein
LIGLQVAAGLHTNDTIQWLATSNIQLVESMQQV